MVSNVRAAQRAGTKLVDVYYDITGNTSPPVISVEISDNGGADYTVPAESISGDVGEWVSGGINKHAVWNAESDWNNQRSNAVKFRITATVPAAPEGYIRVSGGSFEMGDALDESPWELGELPKHQVFTDLYYIAKHEV